MVVTIVGFVVLLVGVVLLPLPGPGMLVIGLGFTILATEFVWAWRAKRYVLAKARDARRRTRRAWGDRSEPPGAGSS